MFSLIVTSCGGGKGAIGGSRLVGTCSGSRCPSQSVVSSKESGSRAVRGCFQPNTVFGEVGRKRKEKEKKRREEQKRDCTRHARANRRCMQQDFVSPRRRRFNLSSLSRHLRVLRGPLFHLPSVPRFRAPTTKARQATHALCTSTQSGPGVIDGTAGLLLI